MPDDTQEQDTSKPAPVVVAHDEIPSQKRAWSPTAIVWMLLIFTILPASLMYALNFERLGMPEQKKRALFFSITGSTVIYLLAVVTSVDPHLDRIWRTLFIFTHIAIAWRMYLVQQPLFVQFIRRGGKKASVGVPVLLSCLFAICVAVGGAGWFYLQELRDIERFNHALTLIEKNQYKDAEAILKDYKTRYPDDLTAHWNLAIIYQETDRLDLARRELQAILRQEPNDKEAKELLREIDELLLFEKSPTPDSKNDDS